MDAAAELGRNPVSNSLSIEMSRLTRDGTAEPVSRDQILGRERGQGNIYFPCQADHEQDWQPYLIGSYSAISDDHTYIWNGAPIRSVFPPSHALSPNDHPDASHLLFFNPTSVDRFPPDGNVGDDDIDRRGKLKGGSSPGQAGRAPEAVDRLVLRGHRDRISVVREGGVSLTNAWETREAENARAAATAAASVVYLAPL